VGSQKIAGMLIENQLEGSRISWVIAGIGLNVNQQLFESATAVSMQHFLGIDVQVKTVLSELLDLMNGYVNNWESLHTLFKAEVEEILFQKGMEANYRDENGEFVGVIQGITNEGKLAVKVMDELRTYNLKEIQFC
jgi:BirA family biotin operon repressor/biotin-[acetyl-CoA-carboxylase] ligase